MTREEAIKRIENLIRGRKDKRGKTELDFALDMAIEALKEQRPHGEWNDYSDEGYVECPFCQHATTCNDDIDELHFCFFCGASMVKKEGDRNEVD